MVDGTAVGQHFALHRRLIEGRARHVRPEDVVAAWRGQFGAMHRRSGRYPSIIAVGYSPQGRLIEMIAQDASAYSDEDGTPLRVLFHANYATGRFLRELGISAKMAER